VRRRVYEERGGKELEKSVEISGDCEEERHHMSREL
jgi:hypothetical protein